ERSWPLSACRRSCTIRRRIAASRTTRMIVAAMATSDGAEQRLPPLAHFGTADVAAECPIIEQKQTSCVLTFRCRKGFACNRAEAPVVGWGHECFTNGVMMD